MMGSWTDDLSAWSMRKRVDFTPDCVNCFDFAPSFEALVLSILPSAIFLSAVPLRAIWLLSHQRKIIVRVQRWLLLKLFAALAYTALQVAILIFASTSVRNRTAVQIAANVLSVLDGIALCVMSWLEHSRSLRPSSLLGTFLLCTLVLDCARTRTAWRLGNQKLGAFLVLSDALKSVSLFLEAREKRASFDADAKGLGPEDTSGMYSRSFFWWLNSLLRHGFREIFTIDALSPIAQDVLSDNVSSRFEEAWDTSRKSRWRLYFALFNVIKWNLPAIVLSRLVLLSLTICQPLLLQRLLYFLQDSHQEMNIGYGLIGAYGLVYIGLAVSNGLYNHGVYRCVTIVRGSLIAAIYTHTLETPIISLDEAAAVTLMSADVERVSNIMKSLHELWANTMQVAITAWLLQRQLGVAFVVPIIVTMLSAIGVTWLSGAAGRHQMKWMSAIQTRIGATAATLASMKTIRMTGLSNVSFGMIDRLRSDELSAGGGFRWLMALTGTIAYMPMLIAPPITFAIFIAASSNAESSLNIPRVLTSLSLLILLTQPLSSIFQNITPLVGAVACCNRIQTFLESPSKSHRGLESQNALVSEDDPPQDPIEISGEELVSMPSQQTHEQCFQVLDGTLGWATNVPVLHDVSVTFRSSSLNVITGPVASGKSTLLKTLLGETPLIQGSLRFPSSGYAYCDQTTWLQNDTIRKNIIGFSDLDSDWYATVIHATALDEDFGSMLLGDQTLVGSNAITLSGGQKQRVALARAIYTRYNILILDDIFSGLDKTTERKVLLRLLAPEGILRKLNATVIVATHSVAILPFADFVVTLGSDGRIAEQGAISEPETAVSYKRASSEQNPDDDFIGATPPVKDKEAAQISSSREGNGQEVSRQAGDMKVYSYYVKSVGWLASIAFLISQISFAFFFVFPTVWLQWWAEAAEVGAPKTGMYLGVYGTFQLVGLASIFIVCWLTLVHIIAKSGVYLHRIILKTVFSAPTIFFSLTDAGTILSRFSQDIGILDSELPEALLDLIAVGLTVIGQAILIARASYFILVAYPFLLGILWVIQNFYLRTSRQLRLLELEHKSPLYSQFLETLAGLTTIRAFGWQHQSNAANKKFLDRAQKPFYLLFMVQRWLGLVLDLVTAGIAILVVGLSIGLRNSVSAGSVGVSLINVISFTSYVRAIVVLWTSTETSMGAIARIKGFSESTATESPDGEDRDPPECWPSNGAIKFENVSAHYSPEANAALSNISLAIREGEKVGVCGRTGSGKSSLILALFRMLELSSGTITIDGLDISHITRQEVRSRLTCIPQEPHFLTGTVRLNMDPLRLFTDEAIMGVLEKIRIRDVMPAEGLDAMMEKVPFSHGQKQLFCLARALLRRQKIVVLDEVSSSVDKDAEEMMHRLIREEFKGFTILAVAHRLETLMDFDRVVVLDAGVMVECGNPTELLSRPSRFQDLYNSST